MANEIKGTIVFEKNWSAIHELNDDGSRKYRYIINEGSSRSSKTRSIIQIYYLYAIQNKVKRMSVWRTTKVDCKATVLKDMVEIYPSMPFYQKIVTLNKTDSIFNFSSSGSAIEINGTDEPNRIHGYNGNVAWFCEPYDISKDTFDQIDMRTTDFIIIDWNPKESHWIDELKKDSRALVIKSTFKDNPFCPPEQKHKILSYQPLSMIDIVTSKLIDEPKARQYNLSENPLKFSEKQISELVRCQENERKSTANKFNWCVYGLGEKAERPNRIFTWIKIPDSEYDKIEARKYYGVDWGTVDPWGIVEAKYYDGGLYLKELNYKSENEWMGELSVSEIETLRTDEGLVKWVFNKLKIDRKRDIICDTNRPMKISALWDQGYDYATSAPKPPGSIIDGISILENLKVYFAESSINLEREQENYSRKVDRYGVVLEEPEDKDNHCFVGETIIETLRGKIRIDQIQCGDLVMTSSGFEPVLKIWNNGLKQVSEYVIQLDTFSVTLTCTDNHKIKTDQGWIQISQLKSGMTVSLTSSSMKENISYTQEKDISKVPINIHQQRVVRVVRNPIKKKKLVYDLTISKKHEYFANGLLVHNCMDCIRYIALWLQLNGILK